MFMLVSKLGCCDLAFPKPYAVPKSSSSASCFSGVHVFVHACVEYMEKANVADILLLCSVVCEHH